MIIRSCIALDGGQGGRRDVARREELSAADAAALLGMTTGRVYQLIAAGVIPATRRGRAVIIPRRAWDRWRAAETEAALANQRGRGLGNDRAA